MLGLEECYFHIVSAPLFCGSLNSLLALLLYFGNRSVLFYELCGELA